MEAILLCVLIIVGVLAVFIRESMAAKKRERQFVASLPKRYGEKPQKEYTPERFVRIPSYYDRHRQDDQLDDLTWDDLNMDSIFKRINGTFSAAGEEYLYYMLRTPVKSFKELEHLEETITFFEENEATRVQVQCLMRDLGHLGKYSLYDYIDNLDYLGERSNVRHLLANFLFVPLIGLLPFFFTPAMAGLLILIIFNILTYFREKREIEPYIVSFAYVLRLGEICRKLLKIDQGNDLREWENIRRYSISLRNLKRGSYVLMSAGRVSASGNPRDILLDYGRMVFHLDLIRFNCMLSKLRLHLEDVDALLGEIGFLETAIAIGAFRKSLPQYCTPVFVEDDKNMDFCLKDAYHPLLEDAVRNSISIDKGVLLTGSNASGKSTFLKTVALNAILAQTIHTCTASEYRANRYRIFSSMALRDNMTSGESYYIVEIKAMRRILDAGKLPGKKVLCFVDEVLRGTNTLERIAASTQILKSLAGKGILCFAATHDLELTELLKEEYYNYHFEEEICDGDILFPYQLKKGRTATRNAIRLLELLGYEQEIVTKAFRQVERFLETGTWTLCDP